MQLVVCRQALSLGDRDHPGAAAPAIEWTDWFGDRRVLPFVLAAQCGLNLVVFVAEWYSRHVHPHPVRDSLPWERAGGQVGSWFYRLGPAVKDPICTPKKQGYKKAPGVFVMRLFDCR